MNKKLNVLISKNLAEYVYVCVHSKKLKLLKIILSKDIKR